MYRVIKLIGKNKTVTRHTIKEFKEFEMAARRFHLYFNAQDIMLKPFIRYGIEEISTGRIMIERAIR